jgi:hypothetical protein
MTNSFCSVRHDTRAALANPDSKGSCDDADLVSGCRCQAAISPMYLPMPVSSGAKLMP